jgi:hypothetical protein
VHRRSLRIAAAALLVVAVPVLAGCASNEQDGTTGQQPSGNGASATVGPIQLRGITIVTGAAGLPTGTLIGTIVNTGTTPDVLQSVTITSPSGARAIIRGGDALAGTLPIRALDRVQIGYNSSTFIDVAGLTVQPSAFAQVQFQFKAAGSVTVPTMTVPPVGIYSGIVPLQR